MTKEPTEPITKESLLLRLEALCGDESAFSYYCNDLDFFKDPKNIGVFNELLRKAGYLRRNEKLFNVDHYVICGSKVPENCIVKSMGNLALSFTVSVFEKNYRKPDYSINFLSIAETEELVVVVNDAFSLLERDYDVLKDTDLEVVDFLLTLAEEHREIETA